MNSNPQNIVRDRPKIVSQSGRASPRFLGFFLLLLSVAGLCLNASAQTWTAVSRALTAEDCLPANNAIDPGETVTVSFTVKNNNSGDRQNVKATLLEQGGVRFPSGEVTVGNVANNANFTVSFTFRADGSCGASLTPTLRVTSNVDPVNVGFNAFQLGATVLATVASAPSSPITINHVGKASPYPSSISVAGLPQANTGEVVDKVAVTLHSLSHQWGQDIQILLVGPNNNSVVLMANAGGNSSITGPINDATLTFEDSASAQVPQNAGAVVSGSYKPSNYGAGTFPDLATPGTHPTHSTLGAAFNNMSNPNGNWRLFVIDDTAGDSGQIAGGWSLSVRTTKVVCCGAGQLAPFVTRIPEKTVTEDLGGAKDVEIAQFTIWDLDDADASKLGVTAISADQLKVVNSNLTVKRGSVVDGKQTVTLEVKQLVANANGDVTITVQVSDPQGNASARSFTLKITPVNDPPTISAILGQKVNVGTATGPIPFTVGDVETLPENLLVLVGSSDTAKVPEQNIVISGTGANRTVNVIPANSSVDGTVTITLTVRDTGDGVNPPRETPRTFVVSFTALPGNPTITPIAATAVNENSSVDVPFVIRSGVEGVSPDQLTLTPISGNTTLLPVSGITFSGSGTDRIVRLTPAANRNGSVQVTIRVTNNNVSPARTDETTFTLTVRPVNTAPTISALGPVSINEDSTSGNIVFTVGDIETPAASLAVTVASDDTTLIPASINQGDFSTAGGYQITADGATRTLRVRPAPNQFGKAVVTVRVTDRGDPDNNFDPNRDVATPKWTETSFTLTVNAVNDPPTMTNPGTITWAEAISGNDAARERTITLTGITPGPANENNQSVTLSAVSSKSGVIQIVNINPATVNQPYPKETTLRVRQGLNQWTAGNDPVKITVTLTDNGGTDLGGVNTATREFNINVTPVNSAPSLAFPTLPPPIEPATLSVLRVAKNRSFTLPMTVSDVETSPTQMEMSYNIIDPLSKFPAGSILFDAARTMVTFLPLSFTDATDLPYTVTVSITAKDKGATNTEDDSHADVARRPLQATRDFLIVIEDKEPPTISVVGSSTIAIDEDNVAQVILRAADNRPVSGLDFVRHSDNPSLVPVANIMLGPWADGNALDSTRTLAIVPTADAHGSVRITITVKDDEDMESAVTINLTVRPVNDPPRITLLHSIAPGLNPDGTPAWKTITIAEDKETADSATGSKLLEFDMQDAPGETPVEDLILTITSSNKTLVPESSNNIIVGGTGVRRTLTIKPAANRSGSTEITLTVSDGELSAQAKFTLVVTAVNDAPTIDQVANRTIAENAGEQTVNLTGITAGADNFAEAPAGHKTLESVIVTVKDKEKAGNSRIAGTWPQTLTVDNDGKASFKFTPVPFMSGVSEFTVTVKDQGPGDGDHKNTTTMKFDVTIQFVNQNPVISFQPRGTPPVVTTLEPPALNVGQNTGIITFYVWEIPDNETPVEFLQVTAESLNPTLVPNTAANLQLGGSHGTRGILIQPAPGQSGTADIRLTVRDTDGGSNTATIKVRVNPSANPTIALNPTSATIGVNEYSPVVFITVFDAQTPADLLKIGWQDVGLVSSDNATLVPASAASIQFGGTGANRAMIIKPNADQTGTARITLTVKDADNLTGQAVFTLTVVGAPPTITSVANQTVEVGKNTPPASFQVNDAETFPGFLIVTGKSSDQSIIPDGNIILLGNTQNRTVTVLAGNKGGVAIITLTVEDAEGQKATTQFSVTVVDNRPPPTITAIADVSTTKNTLAGPITFVVGDAETPVANLVVEATSNNSTLVPNDRITLLQTPGNAASWSLLVNPAVNELGSAAITVKVTNGAGKFATRTFALTVLDRVVENDFNGDGRPDIVLQHDEGWVGAWLMSGSDILSSTLLTPNHVGDLGWRIVGSGDFDGDGKPDLLFRHSDGNLAVWLMDGLTMKSSAFLNPRGSASWKAIDTADFNKDGKVDILFQNDDGNLAVWFMDGLELSSVGVVRPSRAGTGWRAVGATDINNDSHVDIVFQHTDGSLAVWYLIGVDLIMAASLNPAHPGSADWRVAGISDLNQDGNADLLFQNRASGATAVWFMNGPALISPAIINSAAGSWNIVAP
jgi:subtilisin-like proprotein convertase family protein